MKYALQVMKVDTFEKFQSFAKSLHESVCVGRLLLYVLAFCVCMQHEQHGSKVKEGNEVQQSSVLAGVARAFLGTSKLVFASL